ncbi:CHAP domain-containing protein [Nocardia sp. CDC160]|uniref:CHAP domain-containing protein n=1 Tax=Nocardia sp. CDC160 TaxID=3112166 RepID=UPI002DB7FE34|nr:CHAP domain-containing protein [Nocardia sp. CDC160]MEC3916739.1 CHAP domain-containing protein [Nocardia sp. CDC160]
MTVEAERGPRRRRRWLTVGTVALVVISALTVGGVVGLRWWQHHRHEEPYGPRAMDGRLLHDFPDIDTAALSPEQARVVEVLRQQFDEQSGRDKYSEGIDEPWCADFVSWVMRAAGQPLSNPNSGSWRIPGVYTLEEYYRGQQRFEQANNGYLPRVGDVIMYADSSVFHQHTNIVIAVDSDIITTVGGNEAGESGGVAIHKFRPSGTVGLVGFGRLGTR